ncbi:hypothetical protein [Archangium sp.]|uniref:hypothetical protein n=1 Tax=Archangium sp. TaxID=1872627 RepID=UPI002EDB8EB1
MHRESGVHTARPGSRFLPAALLALAVGCGGSGDEPTGTPEPQPPSPAPVAVALEPPTSEPSRLPSDPRPESGSPAPEEPAPQVASWFHRLGGPQDDTGTGLAVDGTGDISVVWLSSPRMDEDREPVPGERRALTLARYAPDGQVRWTREFSRMRVASPSVAVAPSGELFLTGNAFLYPLDFGLGAANDGFLVKFSGDGQALWQRRVGQKVYGVAADGEGGVLVAAEEWVPEGHLPVLAHHDAEGVFRWTRQLDPVAEGTALHAVTFLPSGQALLAGRLVGTLTVDGRTFGTAHGRGLVLLAFTSDGRLAWGKEVRGVEGHVTGVKPAPDGGVALVGEFRGSLPWGGTTLTGSGAFALAAGPDGAEHWLHSLACGARPAPPVVTVDDRAQVVAACGGVLSAYAPEGTQRDERTLSPGECSEGGCPVVGTALGFVPGRGLMLLGHQRHGGAGDAWDQEAFLRLLGP